MAFAKRFESKSSATSGVNKLAAEIEWEQIYHKQKKLVRRESIAPTSSPFDVFKLWEQYQRSKEGAIEDLNKKLQIKLQPITSVLAKGRVDPDTVSKKKYYTYLSKPRYHPEPRQSPCVCYSKPKANVKEQCSPRLLQLSLPLKVQVINAWKNFRTVLPCDFIERFQNLLSTNHSLDPKFARCYFRKLDKIKNKKRKLEKACKRRRRQAQQKSEKWLKEQIKTTSELVVTLLKSEPLLSLNFKEMMLSEAILNALREGGDIAKIPPRNSCKPYGRTIVEIADQLAVWIDTIVRYVDIQTVESEEEIIKLESEESLFVAEDEEEEEEEKEPRFMLPSLPELPEMPPLPDIPEMPSRLEEMEESYTMPQSLEELEESTPEATSLAVSLSIPDITEE